MLNSENITIIIPADSATGEVAARDLSPLLASLAAQSANPGEVIIALEEQPEEQPAYQALVELAEAYQQALPLTWVTRPTTDYRTLRAEALCEVSDKAAAILILDDNLTLEPEALANLIYFWNSQTEPPAAAAMISAAPYLSSEPQSQERDDKASLLQKLFCMGGDEKASLLPSGYPSPVKNVRKSQRAAWLEGRAILWRRDILEQNSFPPLRQQSREFEDVLFSYPIGKKEPLFICAAARVSPPSVQREPEFQEQRQAARLRLLRRYLLVSTFPEFSKPKFFLLAVGETGAALKQGLSGNKPAFGNALGTLEALGLCLSALLRRKPAREFCL